MNATTVKPFFFALLLAGVLGSIASRPAPRCVGLAHEGKPIRAWVEDALDGRPGARATIPKIGAAAVPELAQELRAYNPYRQCRMDNAWLFVYRRMPHFLARWLDGPQDQESRCRVAISLLSTLGPAARGAVPDLIRLLKFDTVCDMATSALGFIGPAAKDAIPALVEVMRRDPHSPVPQALARMGRHALLALPDLAEALQSDSPMLRRGAVQALNRINLEPGKRIVRGPRRVGPFLW